MKPRGRPNGTAIIPRIVTQCLWLLQGRALTTSLLMRTFNVSWPTAKRDLAELERCLPVVRTGGVIRLATGVDLLSIPDPPRSLPTTRCGAKGRDKSQGRAPADVTKLPPDELARAFPLRAVVAEVLNVRFALAADLISERSFADLLHRRLGDLSAPPASHPPGQPHSTAARRMVRDVSVAHLQETLARLIELHARTPYFVRDALLQIDHLVELAARAQADAARYVNPIDVLRAAAAAREGAAV